MEKYSADSIPPLNIFEGIKFRPQMYLGNINSSGFANLILFILDELKPKNEHPIEIEISKLTKTKFNLKIENTDFIQLIHFEELINILKLPSIAWRSSPFDLRFFIAFTEKSTTKIYTKKNTTTLFFDEKMNIKNSEENNKKERITIDFQLNSTIFKNLDFNYLYIKKKLTEFAICFPYFKIRFNDEQESSSELYYFPKGILTQLEVELLNNDTSKPLFIFERKVTINGYFYHFVCSYLDNWTGQTHIKTYVENTELYLGGSLEKGVFSALKSALESEFKLNNISIDTLKKQLILIAQVTSNTKQYRFEGAIKAKLNDPEIEKTIYQYLTQEFKKEMKQKRTAFSKIPFLNIN